MVAQGAQSVRQRKGLQSTAWAMPTELVQELEDKVVTAHQILQASESPRRQWDERERRMMELRVLE